MYKIFTLVAAIAILPVSQEFIQVVTTPQKQTGFPSLGYALKTNPAFNPFGPLTATTNQPPDQLKQSNWYSNAMQHIEQSEYHFKWEEEHNAYCTPNRKQNLRFFYNEDGFIVEPRTTKIALENYEPTVAEEDKKYKYSPSWKVKFNLDKTQLGKGEWQVDANKAEYITDNIKVQYINNKEGMRQNFIVQSPLTNDDELKINFSIKTTLKTYLHGNQIQFFHNKTNVLNYQDLKVWDANNQPLNAVIQENKKGSYFIKVVTKNAPYPITIDPLSSTPNSTPDDANQAGAAFGTSVASAGDVNGDGYSDVIIGANAYDDGANTNEGRAFVYHGSATGLSASPNNTPDDANQANAAFGTSVASAGDVNGDGYSDVIIGADQYNDGANANEGRVFVYHGSASGLSATPNNTPDDADQANARFGASVASAGDVNGDGYSDVIIGANSYDDGANTNEGRAFVYHGSASGLLPSPSSTPDDADQVNARFGISVASAGDVDGDGYSDVIIGADLYNDGANTNEGRVFVYRGSIGGLSATPNYTPDDADQANAQFGISVAAAGDVNGDGYSDVIIGASEYDEGANTDEGRAFVYLGSGAGLSATPISTPNDADQAGAQFGYSVASAGDVNGDGYSDVIIGAWFYDDVANTDEGRAFLYHGSAAGLSATPNSTLDDANQANTYFGQNVASAGDVNGDGYSDVIIGASGYDDGANTDEGRAFVYHGSATDISTTAAATVESNQANAEMGYSVASAGDVNGDGYSDVIVGANQYGNGGRAFVYHGSATGINITVAAAVENYQVNAQMGYSVASAGDVNGDGYSDVIVGAPNYDNGQSNEGAAFVYHGSATGISTTAAATVESNQASAQMGQSVASAGDVNGDGYSDVIVGAWLYDNGQSAEGAAFVYHGSATGISTSAAVTLECNQAGGQMGIFVASAGDVNGDGYSDIIVGANQYDNGQSNEGVAFVYHGSTTGITTTAAATVESNQVNGSMGISVASAGDVNGDGYSDVIVGTPFYDNGQFDEGAAFVYHGSAAGISTTAADTVESNQVSAQMGFFSVASAGDVNGDGYSDVIVGAHFYDNGQTNEGAAFVYHGNSPGINKRNNLRLYNTNLTTPINSSNFLFGNFGAGLYAKSFIGRAKAKLVWETRLNYNAYSGTPITNSTFFTSQQATYTDLGLTGIELKNLVTKLLGGRYTKLRARIKYDPVTAITGQVYSPWRNVSSIIDANNLGILPIELISFNAAWQQKGKTARLDFKTDKESGICCFAIEKSTDGFNFYSIGTLPAKNTSGVQSYSFIDANATTKKQFYRIKIKGNAGQTDYSNIQQLSNDKATEILVFPNPTTDVLQLRLNKVHDKMNVQIFNSTGQIVKQLTVAAFNQIIKIPVQNLVTGKYWLHLQSADEKQVLQFVKQ